MLYMYMVIVCASCLMSCQIKHAFSDKKTTTKNKSIVKKYEASNKAEWQWAMSPSNYFSWRSLAAVYFLPELPQRNKSVDKRPSTSQRCNPESTVRSIWHHESRQIPSQSPQLWIQPLYPKVINTQGPLFLHLCAKKIAIHPDSWCTIYVSFLFGESSTRKALNGIHCYLPIRRP